MMILEIYGEEILVSLVKLKNIHAKKRYDINNV